MKDRKVTGEIKTIRKAIGFLPDPKDEENDIVVESDMLNFALNGDTVEVEIIYAKKDEKLGKVTKIIERSRSNFVGTVEERNGKFGVIPDDKKLYIDFMLSPSEAAKVKAGDKVLVTLGEWTDPMSNPEGQIVRVIGRKGENDVEMESIVLEKGFEYDYPKAVEKEADEIEKNKDKILQDEIPKRRDVRGTLTFTIDPVDAKDFDDAISFIDRGDGTYEIGVHIADVSHYVQPGTALDKEAQKRGTSIYLVDRTIPMLPEVLSNDVCSLNPHEDKLSFSAIFVMNDKAEIQERWFGLPMRLPRKR
jgi:ribonuclease R